ncbi:hypothetical protein L9F63_021984, partial [Diploptera punctata]
KHFQSVKLIIKLSLILFHVENILDLNENCGIICFTPSPRSDMNMTNKINFRIYKKNLIILFKSITSHTIELISRINDKIQYQMTDIKILS